MTVKTINDRSNAKRKAASIETKFGVTCRVDKKGEKAFIVVATLDADHSAQRKMLEEQGIMCEGAEPAVPAASQRAAIVARSEPAAADKPLGKRAAELASAQAGKLPTPPNFEAATHERFRPKLAELVKLAKAGDVKGLRKFAINPISSSPKALDKYRNLCVMALEARAKAA